MKKLLNIFFFLFSFGIVQAQQGIPLWDDQFLEAGTLTEWAVEKKRIAPTDTTLTDELSFLPGKQKIVHFGGERNYIYARIKNIYNQGDSIYLIIDNFNIDSISVFFRQNEHWKELEKAYPYPPATQAARAHVFKLPDPRGTDIYVRLISRNSVVLPFMLATDDGLFAFTKRKQLTETLMLGSAIMLILFNLLFFLWSRERNHLYFLFYNSSIVVYSFFYLRGFAVHFPAPVAQFLTEYAYSIGAISNLAAVIFSRDFLKSYPNRAWLKTMQDLFIGFLLLIILSNAVGFRQFSGVMLVFSGMLTPFMISLIAYFPAKDGYNPAKALFAGWMVAGLGMIIYSLSIANKIPFHWITFALLPLSTVLVDLLILTYAVAVRQINLTREKDDWKEMLLKSMEIRRKELEEQVTDRTRSLKESNERLQQSNAVKNRMISLITHDLKMPLVNLQAILDLLSSNLLNEEQSHRKINDVKRSLGDISDLLENILLWSKQQQKTIRTQPVLLDLQQILTDTTSYVGLLLKQKEMNLEIVLEKPTVYADAFQLETILRNLLFNAGQYAEKGTVIRIGQMKKMDRFCLFVENEGQTLSASDFYKLLHYTEIFRNELKQLHTGIGLQLCAEFLRNHGSQLELESTPEFTRLFFYLPEPASPDSLEIKPHTC